MRLDQALSKMLQTRSRAQDAIREERVRVNGQLVTKNSFQVRETDHIEVIEKEDDFVSRAGAKLNGVLDDFGISLHERVVLDVGASTGGFTDVCLRRGASLVYALDVGHDQLHERLRSDPRCVNMEGRNARALRADWFPRPISFICMDVSFISCRTLLRVIAKELPKTEAVILIKPQFEAGREYLNKHGILKDDNVIIRVLREVCEEAARLGWSVRHLMRSPLPGRDGNREFLMHLCGEDKQRTYDFRALLSER